MNKWNGSTPNSSSASLVWLISFGDLLTLLVCFFLVLTPWHLLRSSVESTNGVITGASDHRAPHGTSLANSSVGPKVGVVSEVPIERHQFADERGRALFTTTLIGALTNDQALNAGIRVRMCSDSGFEETIRSVMSIVTQHKRVTQGVSIELLGTCDQVEVLYPTTAAVAGSIRLVRE